MSTKQKSFFDQKPKGAPSYRKPYYGRSYAAKDDHATRTSPFKTNAPGPPHDASVQSKKKLKAFQFIEGCPEAPVAAEEPDADKENVDSEAAQHKPDVCGTMDERQQRQSQTESMGKEPAVQIPPSTPATRLPLADLIGVRNESEAQTTGFNQSPEEHVSWLAGGTANTPQLGLARKRKRARSSSPGTSSQNEVSAQFGNEKESFDLRRAQQLLKTPQADPAADLWTYYAADPNIKKTPSAQKAAAFAHLIDHSSPHSSATAGSVSGLRRWASCGIEWPSATKPKRRRTQGRFGKKLSEAEGEERASEESSQEPSRIGRLVAQIQESLARPADPNDAAQAQQISPSPVVEEGVRADEEAESPSTRTHRAAVTCCSQKIEAVQITERGAEEDAETHACRKESSEYGDEDFDLDDLAMLDPLTAVSMRQPDTTLNDLNGATSADQIAVNETMQGGNVTGNLTTQHVANQLDDFDDNLTAADLEEVAFQFDAVVQSSIQHPTSVPVDQPQQGVQGIEAKTNRIAHSSELVVDVELEDELDYGDIDDEHFISAEATATQHAQASNATHAPVSSVRWAPDRSEAKNLKSESKRQSFRISHISQIMTDEYIDDRGRSQPQKILVLDEHKTKVRKLAILRQAWYDMPCSEGASVHVIGQFSQAGECIIDNQENMIILHPEYLVTATDIGDSINCLRRAVLKDRVKATSKANPSMFYGNVLHELFQAALKSNEWDSEVLDAAITAILPRHMDTMAELGLSRVQAKEHLRGKFAEFQAWSTAFIRTEPGHDSVAEDRDGSLAPVAVTKLLDVEEHVWSPMYGLKGNIDATVQVCMPDGNSTSTLVAPLELKSGRKTNQSHQAQTILYTLLLSDRYDLDIQYGFLYYLEGSKVYRLPAVRRDLIGMIMKRNELASYARARAALPPVLKNNKFQCDRCYAQKACFLYHKLVENGTGEDIEPRNKFDELVRYLKPHHQDFFARWDKLLTQEEGESIKAQRELFTMLGREREEIGRCFADVVIKPGTAPVVKEGDRINRYQYCLVKKNPTTGFSFTDLHQISVGEPIVVSDEHGHYNLASGYVLNVRRKSVTVAVDRHLHNARVRRPGFDPRTNQDYVGMMEVGDGGSKQSDSPQSQVEPTVFRIDKSEFSNGMAAVRNNLIALMDDTTFKAASLRSLIVDGCEPRFVAQPRTEPTSSVATGDLNTDQQAAIAKVMTAQDYALILGMPGTGKTTTIASIIRALVAQGKSVLLTSYQHTAVDNILLKMKDDSFSILRLGALAKVNAEVQDFAILAARPEESVEQVLKSWNEPPVVATTCLGVNHALFSQRTFDYCIIDEASQITLPVCVGPMLMARTTILVGDHYQLPPVVKNRDAREGGLDMSLFRLLSEKFPQAVTNLEHQYRMAGDVMLLANELIYGGRLKCGSETVASRRLKVPRPDAVGVLHKHVELAAENAGWPCRGPQTFGCHLGAMLVPENRVLFFNTDPIQDAVEAKISKSEYTNEVEARLVAQCVFAFLSCGVGSKDLGVISFNRSQINLLRQLLKQLSAAALTSSSTNAVSSTIDASTVEMHTADKYQGRDKEAIIVSFVRANDANNVGDLLKDWRRVNVAITRARSKLVLIGSRRTLWHGGDDVLRGLVGLCIDKGYMFDLPAAALDGHVGVDGVASQTQTGTAARSSPKSSRAALSQCGSVVKSPLRSGWTKKRTALSELSSGNASPVKTARGALKVPQKIGKVRPKALGAGRPILRDILNDAM